MSDIFDNRTDAPPPPSPPVVEESLPALPPIQRRIPNLGHALLLLVFAALSIFFFEIIAILMGGAPSMKAGHLVITHPKLQLAAEGGAYLVTLITAWLVFPLLWHRSFLSGLQWRWAAARSQIGKLLPLGLLLGILSGIVNIFLSSSKAPPIDQFFASASDAWIITLFGIAVAPVFEEIFFRGFLVPAFAIAYDWVSLERTEAGRAHWQTTTTLSPAAYAFSAILTSVLFAALHGAQLAYAIGPLVVLFSVSMILTWVRVKTQSVAASILVHSAYNSFIFVMTIIGTGGYRHLEHMGH
jgi:uncharacterized protein